MKAGFSQAKVTPPIGMEMEGLGQKGGCQAVHDDLFVRASFFSHEGRQVAILGSDLLFFERKDVDRFKGAIGREIDLAPSRILINTSHNHAGPRLTHWHYSGGGDPAYVDQVESAIVTACREARARLTEVTIHAGTTRTRVPVSRRKPGPGGKAQWLPNPEGTVCDALPFCLFKDAAGRVVTLLFSVSCHPSIYHGPQITAEFPGAATRLLNERFRTEGSNFLQGTGGDTKPFTIADDPTCWRRGDFADIEAAGAEIARQIIAAAQAGLTDVRPRLAFRMEDLAWPLEAPPDRAELERIADSDKESANRRAWAKEMLSILARSGELPRIAEVGLHAIQLGEGLRLIGLEGEAVAGLGLVILKEFNKGVTFPLGYTDGCQLYLPTTEMLDEEGYEVASYWEYHYPSRVAPGGEAVLVAALKRMQEDGVLPNEPA